MNLHQIDYEKNKWNEYYKQALAGQGQEHEHSLWWQISDDDSVTIIKKYLNKPGIVNVLEAGCGSGGSSFYLKNFFKDLQITLCDVAENALSFAQSIEPVSLKGKVKYVISEVAAMPFSDNTFDLTWNVGVVEHYSLKEILQMAKEMTRVTKEGGYVMIAIPNRKSMATLKAYILGSKFGRNFLKWMPGYRFDSEILYGNKTLKNVLSNELKKEVSLEFAGNMLWVSAPTILVRKINSWFPQSPCSFLTFFVFKK